MFNQVHNKKTASIVGIFATSRLVTHFCSGHNVRRFARGDCTSNNFYKIHKHTLIAWSWFETIFWYNIKLV